MKLQDRVAIVTGSGSGIGQATAELFAREGASVIVADNREKRANTTVERIRDAGGRATASIVDVTVAADIERMVNDAVETYGRLDVLHNNAGTIRPGKAPDLDEADWDIVQNTNVKAIFLGAKYAIPQMHDGGAIVNTASISGITADPASIAYGASKAAVINLTRCLAVDHAADKIRVNCICPGVIATPPILRWIFVDEADRERIAKHAPVGSHGPTGRHRQRGALPRFGRRVIHHRRSPRRRWRLHDRFAHATWWRATAKRDAQGLAS